MLHVVIEGRHLTGTVNDPLHGAGAEPSGRRRRTARWPPTSGSVGCYWPHHKGVFDLGIDGWWPDQGDGLDAPSRLNRIRMYWEGSQLWRPERAAVRAASQRLRRHAALRRVPLVGRRLLDVGDAEDARAGRGQHRPDRHSVLGHRHRRLRADAGVHRRAVRALVPVRRVLSAVPRARPHLAPAPAVGLEHRRARARTRRRPTRGAGDPPESELHNAQVEPICRKYPRAALPADAVPVLRGARDAR